MGKNEIMQFVEIWSNAKSSPNSRLAIPSLYTTKLKKETRNVSRTSKALSCNAAEAVLLKPLLSVRLPTAWVWNVSSPSAAPSSRKSMSTSMAPSAELESSTSAISPGRKPVLRKRDTNRPSVSDNLASGIFFPKTPLFF